MQDRSNNNNETKSMSVMLINLHHEAADKNKDDHKNNKNVAQPQIPSVEEFGAKKHTTTNNGTSFTTPLSTNTCLIALPAPSSDEDTRNYLFIPNTQTTCSSKQPQGSIFEVQSLSNSKTNHSKNYGSFFVDSKVVSNGNLLISSRIDPLFFALGQFDRCDVCKACKWTPLDQLLMEFPLPIKLALLDDNNNSTQLNNLLDVSDALGDDLLLYKFNKQKALRWLAAKHERATQAARTRILRHKSLETKQKNTSGGGDGAFHDGFVMDNNDVVNKELNPKEQHVDPSCLDEEEEHQAKLAGLQLVCEYLNSEWRTQLMDSLKMNNALDTKKSAQKKRCADDAFAPNESDLLLQYSMGVDGGGGGGGGASAVSSEEEKKKKKSLMTHGLKKLAKVNTKGMKSLSSFFGAPKKKKQKL